jgi:hypothetical protein
MNYSNLPVYIRKEDGTDALPFANIYDPDGIDNSLYMINKSTAQNTSVQYFNNTFGRVSGNALNYEELFAPKINYTAPDVKILLPQFRSLVFYNNNGTRLTDPAYPGNNLPPLYFSGYSDSPQTIDYVNFNQSGYYLLLRWSGLSDTYHLSYRTNAGALQTNLFSGSGAAFNNKTNWYNYATSSNTGIFCSGFGISANGILNAINSPSGTSLYHQDVQGDFLIKNSTSGSTGLTNILSADPVGSVTGYVAAYTKLTLGEAYHYIPAQNISVDYQAQNDALRVLGVNIDQSDQFTNGAALQAKISFNSYVNTETSGALGTVLDSSGDNFYSIRFGNNIYRGCYLSDYGISVEPFKPIGLNASYVVNNAPVLNSNKQEYITVTTPASDNYLLYSESLTGSNYIYTNLGPPIGGQSDPTGGSKATLISGQDTTINYVSYSVSNSSNLSWVSITGTAGAVELTYLKSDNDLSTGIAFTGGASIFVGDNSYSKVFISNNGIISFDSADQGYSDYQNQEFPIPATTKKFIAAYWKDMFASGGKIWYKQTATGLFSSFTIEYSEVNALSGSQPQTYQIILYFNLNLIAIKYKNITASGIFNPNPNIGIQWDNNRYINYGLNNLNPTKSLMFTRITNKLNDGTNANFVYSSQITPADKRTFSIYLKRYLGNGNIKYTTNSGVNWTNINPPLIEDWTRYSFPWTHDFQQVGIQVETSGDAVYVYGGQLEPLTYSTDYIPTSGVVGIRSASSVDVPLDVVSPSINLTTGFANTMINGNTCSISSMTGFVSNIQNSIRYSVNCGRSPIYNLGQTNASNFILDTVEKQMDISSTDLTSFINFSGSKLLSDLNLTLKDFQNVTGSIISMKSGANIFSQQMNTQENETLTTQVSIKEIVV